MIPSMFSITQLFFPLNLLLVKRVLWEDEPVWEGGEEGTEAQSKT